MGAGAQLQRLLWRVNLALFLVLLFTGMYIALFYRADPIDAYGSALRIHNAVWMGRLARAMHWHAANMLVVTSLLHVISLAVPTSLRNRLPGLSLLLLGLTMVGAVTGTVLPWDQPAYWATQRILYLVGTIPGLGPLLIGEGVPKVTPGFLRSAWQIHVFVLPGIAALAALFHQLSHSTSRKDDRYAPGD